MDLHISIPHFDITVFSLSPKLSSSPNNLVANSWKLGDGFGSTPSTSEHTIPCSLIIEYIGFLSLHSDRHFSIYIAYTIFGNNYIRFTKFLDFTNTHCYRVDTEWLGCSWDFDWLEDGGRWLNKWWGFEMFYYNEIFILCFGIGAVVSFCFGGLEHRFLRIVSILLPEDFHHLIK